MLSTPTKPFYNPLAPGDVECPNCLANLFYMEEESGEILRITNDNFCKHCNQAIDYNYKTGHEKMKV
jgi:hypothetical protein